MAPSKFQTLESERLGIEAIINIVDKQVADNPVSPLTEEEVDQCLQTICQIHHELLENIKQLNSHAPTGTDMQPHKLKSDELFKKSIRNQSALKGLKMKFPVVPRPSTSHTTHPPSSSSPQIKLPRLELSTFDGNLQEFSRYVFELLFEICLKLPLETTPI
ncbi:unnamed protein product [Orchesella dallaii]|uniref:Uncharacterized protein n=1 Tax=Orchesella dallaii TaxID=48710 RepID=A0ABP1RJG5_9HEXA